MSTKRREVCMDANGPPPPQRDLPVDLVLEVAARADVATLVRFAATSKSLRRGILDPDFRSRLLAVRAATGRWFDPALFRAVSCLIVDRDTRSSDPDVIGKSGTPQSSPARISIYRRLLPWHEPVASRDGFLVMRSRGCSKKTFGDLLVLDTFAWSVISLPPISLSEQRRMHTPALLAVDGADRSFELLVANMDLEFQMFSSKAGQWSAVCAVPEHQPMGVSSRRAHPAVLGRIVHWFCMMNPFWRRNPHIIALDVDAGSATTLQLPLSDMIGSISDKETLLAAVGGQLSLIVVGSLEVSMWMSTTSASASAPAWSRQLVIRMPEIEMWAGLDVESIRTVLPVGGFGERSGSLVLQLKNGDLVRLELGTKEATTLRKGMRRIEEVFLHEIDLPSLLQAMRSF